MPGFQLPLGSTQPQQIDAGAVSKSQCRKRSAKNTCDYQQIRLRPVKSGKLTEGKGNFDIVDSSLLIVV